MGTPTIAPVPAMHLHDASVYLVKARHAVQNAKTLIDDPDVASDLGIIAMALQGSERTVSKLIGIGEAGR